jgi:hypothetical protein
MMAYLGWLAALPLLVYFCPLWNSSVLCVLTLGLLAIVLAVIYAIARELWILHEFRDM